jgi:hypothetical protein
MTHAPRAGEVLPRSRIPDVVGFSNVVLAVFLMPMSLYLGWVILPPRWTSRALAEIREKGEADLEAVRLVELRALDEAETTATTEAQKQHFETRRKALEVLPKVSLPREMDQERLGFGSLEYKIYSWVDVASALLLDVLLLVAGMGLLWRRTWGIRLGIATAVAKIVRLMLVYGYVALAIVPVVAQKQGRMLFEMEMEQLQAVGRATPTGVSPTTYMRTFSVLYTLMAVAMIVFGSIYPAIVLWLLNRPRERAACEERARGDQTLTGTRVLGILNVVFGLCLILFGLGFYVSMDALARTGKTLNSAQQPNEASFVARQKAAFDALAQAEETATTPSEKQASAAKRRAIESRPKPPNGFADAVRKQMGFDDPKFLAYYRFDLVSGLLLNVAMSVAGIGLLGKTRWGITLGLGTAGLKIVRLGVLYGYFALVLAPLLAERGAAMEAQLMAVRQPLTAQTALLELDPGPLVRVYAGLYPSIAVALLVLGSIYPAISLWVLNRARRKSMLEHTTPDVALNETSEG